MTCLPRNKTMIDCDQWVICGRWFRWMIPFRNNANGMIHRTVYSNKLDPTAEILNRPGENRFKSIGRNTSIRSYKHYVCWGIFLNFVSQEQWQIYWLLYLQALASITPLSQIIRQFLELDLPSSKYVFSIWIIVRSRFSWKW